MNHKKILLCDIDGTICEDIPNEEVHRMATAQVFPDALDRLNRWYANGDEIHFFTARTEEMREVTEQWLVKHGFQYHSLIMNKPRIKDGEVYMWIDNRPVKAITFKDRWTELVKKEMEVDVFAESSDFTYHQIEID